MINISRVGFIRTVLLSTIITLSACSQEKVEAIKTWKQVADGVTFRLTQIPVDQVNAFYLGRGFSLEQIKPYAKTCVYTAIMRNDTAEGHIHFLRKNWSVIHKGTGSSIKASADWLKQFKQNDVKPASLIAFRFAQIPEEQEYDTGGDWNQGMLSVDLPLGSQFDIVVRWDIKGKPYELTLNEVSCVE